MSTFDDDEAKIRFRIVIEDFLKTFFKITGFFSSKSCSLDSGKPRFLRITFLEAWPKKTCLADLLEPNDFIRVSLSWGENNQLTCSASRTQYFKQME